MTLDELLKDAKVVSAIRENRRSIRLTLRIPLRDPKPKTKTESRVEPPDVLRIVIQVTPVQKAYLDSLRKEGYSVSAYFRKLLEEDMKKKGP